MNKRVVFVLVEGDSEKISLTPAFEQAFPKKKVVVSPYYGDITTDKFGNLEGIKERIYVALREGLRQYSLDYDDVAEIIHLVDTDGAYLENKRVIENANLKKTQYNAKKCCINTSNKYSLEKRNQYKRDTIDYLVGTDSLFGIPYRVFYMSCNLDHVLHDNPNLKSRDKRPMAKSFAAKYCKDYAEFIDFIAHSSFSEIGDYMESWDQMRFEESGLKSISRLTNLGIVFVD